MFPRVRGDALSLLQSPLSSEEVCAVFHASRWPSSLVPGRTPQSSGYYLGPRSCGAVWPREQTVERGACGLHIGWWSPAVLCTMLALVAALGTGLSLQLPVLFSCADIWEGQLRLRNQLFCLVEKFLL